MRALQIFNFVGVIVLAALCVFQWRVNRELNLHMRYLEKSGIEKDARTKEQDTQIKGQAADLDSFREHVQRATADLKAAESNLVVSRREVAQLTLERDQLKEGIAGWSRAVAERDEQLKLASDQLKKLAEDRNEAVTKFNDLARKHNETVDDLNNRIGEFNSLVERFNALAKTASQAGK